MMPLELLQSLLRRLDRILFRYILQPFGLIRPQHSRESRFSSTGDVVTSPHNMRPLYDFQQEVVMLFSAPCNIQSMQYMSTCLQHDYDKKLHRGTTCMLPSFCHALPTGQEQGSYVALDMGGSTFRVALVDLTTRDSKNGGMSIRHMNVNKIDESIRRLPSKEFFAWMATKIKQMLVETQDERLKTDQPIPMGLAWSFPIEQTSHRGGKVQPMGKGFRCHEGSLGQDLGSLIETACLEQSLHVSLEAIINDSSATLLSQAYKSPDTTMGVILGTGTNAAVYLPVSSIGTDKFGARDSSWFAQADRVIVNTEVSMFGRGILPMTRWDEDLNRHHQAPDFQPLEYMTTGRYLGEVLRLVILEAVVSCNLFGGVTPTIIRESYSLDTAILAVIEGDVTEGFVQSAKYIRKAFGLPEPVSSEDLSFLRSVVAAISHRAAAYMATALHALWSVQRQAEAKLDPSADSTRTAIASNGSVILMYPGFKEKCEAMIADILASESEQGAVNEKYEVVLEPTTEAAILGAAVAVATSLPP